MKIQIKKFKTIDGLELEIPAQISGGNGAGKTTILEAISFCLTGKDLRGKELEQIYHRDDDLHDAIADVTFTDNYGNTYRRVVQPVFQTSRSGVEELKIKRNTQCYEGGIAVNDYAPKFSDFARFGTNFFFEQKEDDQRKIFIDSIKSKMPEFDLEQKTLELKSKKKTNKTSADEINLQTRIKKELQNVEILPVPEFLEKQNKEYELLTKSDNSEKIAEINRKNNELQENYLLEKSSLTGEKLELESKIQISENQLISLKSELEKIANPDLSEFDNKNSELVNQLNEAEIKFKGLKYYDTIEGYAKENFAKNPVVVENVKKIKEIQAREFDESKVTTHNCPNCNYELNSNRDVELLKFENDKQIQISDLRSKNRSILQNEVSQINSNFLALKNQVESLKSQIYSNLQKRSEACIFGDKLKEAEQKIVSVNDEKNELKTKLQRVVNQLENLKEPEILKLPEAVEISEELENAHNEFLRLEKLNVENAAINRNNTAKRSEIDLKIKEQQKIMFDLDAEIVKLQNEISEYFSNLKGIVKTEFAGSIEIDVELQEYVITRDEYKDVFKITANGKIFPYECNGALQNNVKLQILANLQRLHNYNGITILDNCEANTTQPINTCDVAAVLAMATMEDKLTIQKL